MTSSAEQFLARFRARAPQTAAFIGLLTTLAATPASAHSTELDAFRATHPAATALVATTITAAVTPAAPADLCFGPIRSSKQHAEVLAFDRRLSVAMWLDRDGRPTDAPSSYRDSQVMLIGRAPDASTPNHVSYLFAEHQSPSAQQRTLELLRTSLTGVDLATVTATRLGPLDGCGLADIQTYPQAQQMNRVESLAAQVGQRVVGSATWQIGSAAENAVGQGIANAVHRLVP